MGKQLFNSLTASIPEIRRDVEVIPIREQGQSYLYFYDQRCYVPPDFALRREVSSLLSLIDGRKSISDLQPYLNGSITQQKVLEFIRFLDENRLLNSDYFEAYATQTELEYEQSTVHRSVTAGRSYPADPEDLRSYLDDAFAGYQSQEATGRAKALYAPHIDPRAALDSYVAAFAPIRKMKPKRVVMLATSHYAGWYPKVYEGKPFILVDKDFEMPLGTICRDKERIDELSRLDESYGITTRDRAHRMEHSIELHLLFLHYLWEHDVRIIPFLVRSLDELYYMKEGYLGQQLQHFSQQLNQMFGEDEETFFLVSGDLAHFGKKFGDDQVASSLFSEVKDFDQRFLEYGSGNQRSQLLSLMKEQMDPYRICGFPPLYTFLNSMPDLEGEVLSYDLWDERERQSAVTFGSILYGNGDKTD